MKGIDIRCRTVGWLSAGFIGVLVLNSMVLSHNRCIAKPIMQYTTTKSVVVTVYLVHSERNKPLFYKARLQSPVCMEDLCNPIDVEIEWDLLGDFKGYNEYPDEPITKFDHKPLTLEDHEKLKNILGNKESLLQDYRIEDLVDPSDLIYSEELDGMTGATSKTFENDIVPGAVYTCYTLWHFVNGDLQNKLKEYSESIMNEDLLVDMIQSGKKNYLEYILKNGPDTHSPEVNQALGSLIWESDPISGVKIISALNDGFWLLNGNMKVFREKFLHLANPVQNALIRHFINDGLTKDYLYIFLQLLPDLKEFQKSQVYDMMKMNADIIDTDMQREITNTFKDPTYPMTVKEYELLDKLGIDY